MSDFHEASLIFSNVLYCLDRLLKDIQNNDILFDRKVFILGGDFEQVLPVVFICTLELLSLKIV